MTRNPVRITILVGAAVLLILTAVLWLFVLSPRLARASEIQSQQEMVASQNVALQAKYNRALQQAREAPQSARDAVALFQTMPQEADLPQVLDQITQAAKDAGIPPAQISSLRTSIPEPVAAPAPKPTPTQAAGTASGGAASGGKPAAPRVDLATIGIEISATGKQGQLLDFLDNLRSLDRALLVTSSGLSTSAEAGADTLTVEGQMFVLQSQLPDLVSEVQDLLSQAQLPSAAPSAG